MTRNIPYINIENSDILNLYRPIVHSTKPQLILLHDFLDHETCDNIISLSEEIDGYKRGCVYKKEGGFEVSSNRTNDSYGFTEDYNEKISYINEKIATTCNWYKKRANKLNILRYSEKQKFNWHHDYHTDSHPHAREECGQRLGTMVIYLNNVERGGETVFKHLKKIIKPQKGCALFWNYDWDNDPETAKMTEHGGNTVQKGTKYILTRWLTERESIFK